MTPERKGQIERGPTGEDVKRIRDERGWRQEDAATALGVSLSTIKRWESGGPIAKRRDIQAIRALQKGEVAVIADHMRPGDEVTHIVDQVRRLAMRFNVRSGQHAKPDELARLRRELLVAVQNGLEAAGGDDPAFQQIVEALVDLLTSEGAPAKKTDSKR